MTSRPELEKRAEALSCALADFAAHLRQDVPDLVAEVRRLRMERAWLADMLEAFDNGDAQAHPDNLIDADHWVRMAESAVDVDRIDDATGSDSEP